MKKTLKIMSYICLAIFAVLMIGGNENGMYFLGAYGLLGTISNLLPKKKIKCITLKNIYYEKK